MLSFQFLTVALLAATTSCSPIISSSDISKRTPFLLETRARSNCTQFASVAAGSVCIDRPSDCTATYLVQPDDTCASIGNLFNNFTLSALYYWNPDIGQTCFGLQAYVPVCINTPWYTFTPPIQASGGTVESAAEVPVPVMPLIVANCTSYEFVGDGLRVDAIVAQNNITMSQFLSWNGDVDSNSPVVWADYWVCVGA